MTRPPLNLAAPLPRHAEPRLREALLDTRIVAIVGPRQSGKSTLARRIASPDRPYLSLDDEAVRAFARDDPTGFARRLDRAVIDEIQRSPDLILALKRSVDEDPRPGRFLLTGSADIFAGGLMPDSLAGRVETVRLLPLSQAELDRVGPPDFLDRAFRGDLTSILPPRRAPGGADDDLIERVLCGGFAEPLGRASPRRRRDWFRSYVDSLARRDIPELATLDKLGLLPRLIQLAALLSGEAVNLTAMGVRLGLDAKTVDRWLVLLENVFLAARTPPWFRNDFKRMSKAPKLHFFDTGVLAALRGLDADALARDRTAFGPLLESLVFTELAKTLAVAESPARIYHYRDRDQVEVDFVLERAPGEVVALEVKASSTVRPDDFKGLRRVRDAAGAGFAAGIVLHGGDTLLPVADRLWAVPLSVLWS